MKPNKSDIFDSMDIDKDWIHTEVLGEGRKKGGLLSILTFALVLVCAVALIFIAFKDMFGKSDLSNLENMSQVTQEQRSAADAEKAKQDAAKALADAEAKKQADQTLIYTVKSGDTLAGIADDFKVNMNTIADANGLTSPYALDIGQQLKIPGVKSAETAPANGTNAPAGSGSTYTVKSGDTLAQIGIALGIDYKTIAALNNIQAPYNLEVGQVLKIK